MLLASSIVMRLYIDIWITTFYSTCIDSVNNVKAEAFMSMCFFVLFFFFFFFCLFFFFKQKTAYEILTCDWSSDVCSSDLSQKNY